MCHIFNFHTYFLALLQHGADSKICNTDGKTAYDLAEPIAKSVLSGISLDWNWLFDLLMQLWKTNQ